MNYRKNPFSTNAAGRKLDPATRTAVERLGGEPLEGSGFEDETPEPDFQLDWTGPIDRTEGGLR
jgi:hypothetical protein